MPVIFDAEGVVTGDFADLVGGDAVLPRGREDGGKIFRRNGDEGAGAAFVEEGEFGGGVPGQSKAHAERRKSRFLAPRTPLGMTSF